MLPSSAVPIPVSSRPGPRRAGLWLAVATTFAMAAGDGLAGVALAIRVYGASHAGWAVALVFLATSLPVVVLAPVAGLALDRLPLRRTLIAAALWVALVGLALSFVPQLWLTLLLATGFGVGAALLQPGLATLVPRLVEPERLVRANGYVQAATWGGITLGPVLAGTLSALGGAHLALRVDAVAYLVGAGILALLPARSTQRDPAEERGEPFTTRITAGFRFLRDQADLGVLVSIVATMIAFVNLATVAEVGFAETTLRAGSGGYAALVAAWTGAMVVGTLVAGRLRLRQLFPATLVAVALTGLCIGAAGLSPSLRTAIVAYAVGGFVNGIEVVSTRALLNHRVPAAVAGRVLALYSGLVFAASGVGTAMGGSLLAVLSPRTVLLVGGAGALVVGSLGVLHHTRGHLAPRERERV